jgi:nucleoside-diphosphate-sugar epimerase
MKIFVTGSNGFIGKNLCDFYANHHVYRYGRGDLRNELATFMPDLIINCAAEIYDHDKMWESNVDLVRICCEHTKNHKNRMIQIGSSSEYGTRSTASSEFDRINPMDMYQATKGAATLLCQGYARYHDLDITIIRPYSVYGRYEKPHRLFPRLWRSYVLQEPMTLYDGYHDFIYIDDFVRGLDIISRDITKPRGDIVNLGSGKQWRNIEVSDIFEKITGVEAPITYIEKMAKTFETSVWLCNTEYSKSKYAFECQFDLYSGIKHFIETASYGPEK